MTTDNIKKETNSHRMTTEAAKSPENIKTQNVINKEHVLMKPERDYVTIQSRKPGISFGKAGLKPLSEKTVRKTRYTMFLGI